MSRSNTRPARQVLVGAMLLVALLGCDGGADADPTPTPTRTPTPQGAAEETEDRAGLEPVEPFGQTTLVLAGDGREIPMPAYVADEPALRQPGLMRWDELPAEAGMVFLFPEESSGGFWMKDTRIPLSIAYFDAEGQILAILDMEPCPADPCPTYNPEVAYRGALEVNQGAFGELGVGEGWRVLVPEELWPQP